MAEADVRESSFVMGDKLQLKSGGAAMTAGEHYPGKGRRCVWMQKERVQERFFPEEMLQLAEEGPRSIDVRFVASREATFREALEKIAGGANDARQIAANALQGKEQAPQSRDAS